MTGIAIFGAKRGGPPAYSTTLVILGGAFASAGAVLASLEVTDCCRNCDCNSIFNYETQTNEANTGPQFRSAAVQQAWEERQRNSYKSTQSGSVTLAASNV